MTQKLLQRLLNLFYQSSGAALHTAATDVGLQIMGDDLSVMIPYANLPDTLHLFAWGMMKMSARFEQQALEINDEINRLRAGQGAC